jgi:AraC-like DNA-binding protein
MPRLPKKVDEALVEKLGRLLLTQQEICEFVGVSERTLRRRFGRTLARARASAKLGLRRAQYLRAVRDNSDRMLIHLGRCELGQRYTDTPGGALDDILDELLSAKGDDDGSAD